MEVALNSWTGKPTHVILLAQAEVTIVTNRNDARRGNLVLVSRRLAGAESSVMAAGPFQQPNELWNEPAWKQKIA
jgi:hypothetical protein